MPLFKETEPMRAAMADATHLFRRAMAFAPRPCGPEAQEPNRQHPPASGPGRLPEVRARTVAAR